MFPTGRKGMASNKVLERVHINFLETFMDKIFLLVIDSFSTWLEVNIMNNIVNYNQAQGVFFKVWNSRMHRK
jgi:hypothetical protein